MGRKLLACAVLLFMLRSICFASPQEALAIAAADIKTVDPNVAPGIRYLDLTHFAAEDRVLWYNVLSYHINSLSRESFPSKPRPISNGGVLAINLYDYGIDPKTYDKLATVDPYFNVRLIKTIESGGKPEGKPYQAQDGKWYKEPAVPGTSKTETVPSSAPWLTTLEITDLIQRTQSIAPLLRGDWFFFQTAIQEDRVAGYYDFLGLGKKLADFDNLVGANRKFAVERNYLTNAAVAQSGVAINNRAIEREQVIARFKWTTFDFKTNTNKQNAIRLQAGDTDPPHGDANEIYGVLPNGLPVVFLADANGVRQDSVPPFIAPHDTTAPGKDVRIHPYLSCTRCHVEGLRGINDWVRKVYRVPLEDFFRASRVEFRSPVYYKQIQTRNRYFTNLEGFMALDRLVYEGAARDCNGLSIKENSELIGRAWKWYAEPANLGATQIAVEVGCTEQVLMEKIREYASPKPNPADNRISIIDPVLASLLATPPVPIRREHLEEIFFLIEKIVHNLP